MSVYLKFEDGTGSSTAANTGYAGGPFAVSPHAISAAYVKNGSGSLRLVGTNGGTMPITGISGPGTGDYTAEMWVLFPTMPLNASEFCGQYEGGFYVASSSIGATASGYLESAPSSISANVWYHIALCRSGSTARFFLNGTLVGSRTDSTSISAPFQLGENGPYAHAVVAHVDEYRFTNSALYTANFTPQSPLVADPPKEFSSSTTLADVTAAGTFGVSGSFTSSVTLGDIASDGVMASAGARYWRLNATEVDGSTEYASLTKFQLYASTDGTGTNLCVGASASQSGDGAVGAAAAGIDNNTNNEAGSSLPLPWTFTVDLGSAKDVKSLGIVAQRVVPNRTPKTFTLEYSANNVDWTVASSFTGQTGWTEYQRRVFEVVAAIPGADLSGSQQLDDATSSGAFAIGALAEVGLWSLDTVVPAATLFAEVVPYEGFRLDGAVPAATGMAWFGIRLDKTLPSVQLQAVGTVPNTLRLAAELPNVALSANILNGRSFSVNASVPSASLSAWTGWQLSASVPVASMSGGVVTGGAYRLNAAVPMASVQSSAVAVNVLRLTGTVPAAMRSGWVAVNKTAPAAKMMGGILPVVGVTRLAYSFTLANSAMTRYPAYPFIQVLRIGTAYYGVAEDGLYELGGATDNGTAIPWAWETCMSDFGAPEKKTVVSAYLGGYVPQDMAYTIKTGDLPTGTNAHTTTATSVMRNHRQKFGIGRKSRFFAFGLSAAQGRVAIDSIEFEMASMSRRV